MDLDFRANYISGKTARKFISRIRDSVSYIGMQF